MSDEINTLNNVDGIERVTSTYYITSKSIGDALMCELTLYLSNKERTCPHCGGKL